MARGAVRRADGNFELRSRQPSPAGDLLRITVVDAARGWVLEQHLFGTDGALLAREIADRYQHDRPTGVWLPTRVRIQIVPAQISLLVELRETLINQPAGDPRELWAKPNYTGYAEVDLARAMGGLPTPPAGARPQRPADAPAPRRLSRLPSIGGRQLAQPFSGLGCLQGRGPTLEEIPQRADLSGHAAEASEEGGGTITISTRRAADHIEIRLADTGGGIPAHARDRVFDPFFTTKEAAQGTGLGLAIAQRIATEYGGRIERSEEHTSELQSH